MTVGGRCPSPSTWGPPVNRSCAFQCLGFVFATLAPCVCDIVWSSVLVRVLSGAFVLAIMSVYLSGLSDETNPFGSLVRTCNLCRECVLGGGSLGGEVLDLSVPKSPKAALQRCGAAHGPLHPAVFFSKLCCLCLVF